MADQDVVNNGETASSQSSKQEKAVKNGQKDKKLKVKLLIIKRKPAETVSRCPSDSETATTQDGQTEHRSPLQAVDPMQQWGVQATMYPPMPPMQQMHQMPPQMAYYPMFPPQWPQQWESYDEEAEPDTDYDDENELSEGPELDGPKHDDHNNTEDKPSQNSSIIKSALLASHKTRYVDEIGDNANPEVAEIANQIWTAKQEKEATKELLKKKKDRPTSISGKWTLTRRSYRQFLKQQKLRICALDPFKASQLKPRFPMWTTFCLDWQSETNRPAKLVDLAIDGVTLLAHANQQLNQLRRDMLRPTLQPRFQQLCSKPSDDDTQYLFGTKIVERIRNASQGGKLARRGRGRGSLDFNHIPQDSPAATSQQEEPQKVLF